VLQHDASGQTQAIELLEPHLLLFITALVRHVLPFIYFGIGVLEEEGEKTGKLLAVKLKIALPWT